MLKISLDINSFQTPSKPSDSAKNASLFSNLNISKTASPFRNPSFTTPRKPFDPELFSEASGAESSPADNADIDTPDVPKAITMPAFTGAKSTNKPIFGRYGQEFIGNSPGRGELRRGKYADVVNKVRKRKRLDRDYGAVGRRGSWDSESDSVESRPRSRDKLPKDQSSQHGPEPRLISTFFDYLLSRPGLPYVLSYYPQLLLNYFLVGLSIWIIWGFYAAIRADIDKASETAQAAVLAEMALCAKQYVENRCSPETRVRALESVCDGWEHCMNRDPSEVGRAQVSARTFAVIFNSFVEPISWKTMVGCPSCEHILGTNTFPGLCDYSLSSWRSAEQHSLWTHAL
jgi:hypothetical protein